MNHVDCLGYFFSLCCKISPLWAHIRSEIQPYCLRLNDASEIIEVSDMDLSPSEECEYEFEDDSWESFVCTQLIC